MFPRGLRLQSQTLRPFPCSSSGCGFVQKLKVIWRSTSEDFMKKWGNFADFVTVHFIRAVAHSDTWRFIQQRDLLHGKFPTVTSDVKQKEIFGNICGSTRMQGPSSAPILTVSIAVNGSTAWKPTREFITRIFQSLSNVRSALKNFIRTSPWSSIWWFTQERDLSSAMFQTATSHLKRQDVFLDMRQSTGTPGPSSALILTVGTEVHGRTPLNPKSKLMFGNWFRTADSIASNSCWAYIQETYT